MKTDRCLEASEGDCHIQLFRNYQLKNAAFVLLFISHPLLYISY